MLALVVVTALSAQPAPMNAERYWSLKRTGPHNCVAAARADSGEVAMFGISGRISLAIARKGLPQDTKTIELRTDDRRQALPAQAVGDLIGEKGEGLSSASIVALRKSRTLAVALDGRETMKLDLTGSGTSQLIDDLLDCSLDKAGWWDGEAAPAPRSEGRDPSVRKTQAGSLLPPAPAGAKPGSIPMGPAGSK